MRKIIYTTNAIERAAISELYRFFHPELIGRFDEKVVFKPLSPEIQREIGGLAIAEETARYRERGFDLTISDEAFESLVPPWHSKNAWRTLLEKRFRKSSETLSETHCSQVRRHLASSPFRL